MDLTGSIDIPVGLTESLYIPMGLTGFIDIPVSLTESLDNPAFLTGSLDIPVGFTGSIDIPADLTESVDIPLGPRTFICNLKVAHACLYKWNKCYSYYICCVCLKMLR